MTMAASTMIQDIAYALPETLLTNAQLRLEHPGWDMDRIQKRTGVSQRYVAAPGETALDLAHRAACQLFAAHPDLRSQVDGILFCTETADHIIPPNACILHGRLGLPEHVLAFDVDLGCSGYPYCLAVARGLVATGMARNLLVANADTYSKLMDADDQSVRVLFGDAAAVSWIAASDGPAGILDIQCGTAGAYYDKFIVPDGGCRLLPEGSTAENPAPANASHARDKIKMDGASILAFANTKVPAAVTTLLKRNGLSVADIDLFVFHQASQMVLDSVARMLRIKPEQLFSNLANVGNTVSASIPMVLKDALMAGRLAPGSKVVLCGFGLGLSWGSVLLQWR
jgi:3-oxoacyl-[acyl-carrier-protein] synthase-3